MTHEQRRAHFVASVVQDPEHDDDPRVGRCSTELVPAQRLARRSGRTHAPTVSERRRVVVRDELLYALDASLPQAPTAGRPSRAQFISTDLLEAVEQFAVGWDDLAPLIRGRDDYRVFISRGRLVYAFVVQGQPASDGTVELVSIELDVTGPAA